MADTKISALPAATTAAAANEFAINEAGTSKKLSGTLLKNFVLDSIKNYGAVGDGVTDDSAAFIAAATAAKNSSHTLAQGVATDPGGLISIYIPPGDYLIVTNHAMLGSESMAAHVVGLKFYGAGKHISNIIFKPASAGNLIEIDWWLGLTFEDLSFYADTAGCTCFYSNTTHNAQLFQFRSCSFDGFKYDIRLDGDNNNSEINLWACDSYRVEAAGAHFYTASATASDQFLNYWWVGCRFWSTSAPFIDSSKGGSYHVTGLDASDWGTALVANKYLFYLRGTSHNDGVCTFTCRNLRTEIKNALGGILYSEWPYGYVTFDGIDMSSQTPTYTYGTIIYLYYDQTDGPAYVFRNGLLSGGVTVSYGDGDYAHMHMISFQDVQWIAKATPSDVVTYDRARVTNATITNPAVQFIRCRAREAIYNDPLTNTGASVWDATIGYNGQMVQQLQPRCLRVGGGYGIPFTTEVPKIRLPVGAIITSFEAFSPPGTSVEADGGTWTLRTTDGSPVTVATITVSGAMSAGFSVVALPPGNVPFLCSTTAKATLTITPGSVSNTNTYGIVLVKGYW